MTSDRFGRGGNLIRRARGKLIQTKLPYDNRPVKDAYITEEGILLQHTHIMYI